MTTVVLALAASLLFGVGVALQQQPAWEVPERYAARLGLLWRVARRPVWLAGVVAEGAGFACQVAALRHGSLVVVQPIITTSLLFTIALAAATSRRPVSGAQWVGLVAVLAGLSTFLVVASPSDLSSGQATPAGWWVTGACFGAALAVVMAGGRRAPGRRGAALLAVGAGLGDAFMAVLTKAFAHTIGDGVVATARSWTPYALCAVGVAAMLLTQSAYQTGRPTLVLPLITVIDPLVSSGIGVGLFGEALHLDGARGPTVAVAIVVMIAGLAGLARSGSEVMEVADRLPAARGSRP